MNKKTKKKYKKFVIAILLVIIIFLLLYFFINDDEKNNILFNSLKDLSSSIMLITTKSSDDSADKLTKEINKDYQNEINNLKKILDLNSVNSDKEFINATIIKRSTKYWYDIITIDKGKKDGIKKGNAVINSSGLIGKVIKVNNRSSDVKLLISSSNKNYISASFSYDNNTYYGVIDKYELSKNELILKDVVGDFDKSKIIGTNIVTSGLSDSFSSGLLIGEVKSIQKDTYGISYIIRLKPSVNFNDINIVSVIKGAK